MKNTVLILMTFWLIEIFSGLNAQNWVQIGGNINGDAEGDEFGRSISLSYDGSVMAVNALTWYGVLSWVKIYKYNGNWELTGKLTGNVPDDGFGESISLNRNGTVLAVGVSKDGTIRHNGGAVKIYEYYNGSWTQKGNTIYGDEETLYLGTTVKIGKDSMIVAFTYFDMNQNINSIRIMKYNELSNKWIQRGGEISDVKEASLFMSDDCSVIITTNDKIEYSVAYKYDQYDNRWHQLGNNFLPDKVNALSGDGLTAASLKVKYSSRDIDTVRVYSFDTVDNLWKQKGNYLSGSTFINEYGYEKSDDFGGMTYLSYDGSVLAVSVKYDNTVGLYAGQVKVFEYSSRTNTWEQVGEDINALSPGDFFGRGLSCSYDGSIFAAGAVCSSESFSDAGQVRVFGFRPVITNEPEDVSDVCAGEEVKFAVSGILNSRNTWQEDPGGVNGWVNITNDSLHSGAYEDTLRVKADLSLNRSRYQCLVGNCAGLLTSTAADFSLETLSPVIVGRDTIEVVIPAGDSFYTVSGNEFDPVVSDNCGVAWINNDFNNMSTLSGAQMPLGKTDVAWLVTDISGNISQFTSVICVTDSSATNITDISNSIKIYPNPASGIFNLEFSTSGDRKIVLSDMSGKSVYEKVISGKKSIIDLTGISPGMYLMSIYSDNDVSVSKIIKK
jgi:hypothetical protein